MPISFADKYCIDVTELHRLGVFNPILDVDSRIYVDPAKLGLASIGEFKNSKIKVEDYFRKIVVLLNSSEQEGDIYWKKATELFTFKEMPGTCLGYSKSGTSGNGIAKVLSDKTLRAMKDLIDKGRDEPILFEIINVFQEGIGCDRVSDLLVNILYEEILMFTDRICRHFKIDNHSITYEGRVFRSCKNEFNNTPLLLVPEEFVTPLPLVQCFEDIEELLIKNQEARDELKRYVPLEGNANKTDVYRALRDSDLIYDTVVGSLKNIKTHPYNFQSDPCGEHIWYSNSQTIVNKYPLELQRDADIWTIVNDSIDYLKRIVENNGVSQLLYREDGKPHKESYAQKLFDSVVRKQCELNNIDLSPETNSGRGPVDFKLSRGQEKVLVEIKLTTNSQLVHGIEKQLPIYMKQEQCSKAIYLIFDVATSNKPREKILKIFAKLPMDARKNIRLVLVDATAKRSASKA